MSEEFCYSIVVYNSLATDSRTTGQETTYIPNPNPNPNPAQTPEKTEHRYEPQQCAIVFLSLTCAFLLAGIIALFVCYYLTAGQLRKENSALMEANQHLKNNLTAQKESLESENTQLLKDQTLLDEILQFHNFPVEKYCSEERRCSRCPSGWTFNNSKCYFVYLGQTWKTWEDSRLECIKMGGDLLTIQNEEEQMFIMNLAPTYYDKLHGYWIGLTGKAQDWVWIYGSSLTTGFWADAGSQNETHVLTNTGHEDKVLNSWRSTNPDMLNRWICENKALLF